MRRLTKKDWETINEALALLEAEDPPSQTMGYAEEDDQAHYDHIQAARQKVWERLPDG